MDDDGPTLEDAAARRFADALARRQRAADGLERDLLTEVPMLYGSPGRAPLSDPGVTLARIHREEMLRRNGGGIVEPTRTRRAARLPFERTVIGLLILYYAARFLIE